LSEFNREFLCVGFWAGWVPRAIGEVCLICLSSSLTFFINRYVITDSELKQYTSHVVGFLASSLVYPFTVVSNTMIVSK
jgi:carrier protein